MVNWMSRLLVSWKGSSPNSGLGLDLYLFVKLIHPVLNHWHQNRATKRTKCLWITQDVQDFGSVLGNQCSKSWPHSFPSCWLTLFFLPNVFALNFPRLHFRFHLHFQLYIFVFLLVLLPLLIILLFLLLLLLIPLLFSYVSSYSFSAHVETNIVSLIIMSPALFEFLLYVVRVMVPVPVVAKTYHIVP